MRDLLIRYLLGELDDAELRQLEERLRNSPELRRELDYLRTCFSEGGDAAAAGGPPPGLAQRTTQQVSSLSDDADAVPRPVFSAVEPPSSQVSWSLADISVAAGVFLAVSMLLLPALRGSRDSARLNVCSDNLRTMGRYFVDYADRHNGMVPRVGPHDCAGIFALRLIDSGVVTADDLKRRLVCPASKQRDIARHIVITIPSGNVLMTLSPEQIEHLVQVIPISYAYRIGYVADDKYHCSRKLSSCEPLLADAPRFDAFGPQLESHNACGVNVLNVDGSVRYQKCLTVVGLNDHLFLNNLSRAAAGQGPYDVVLSISNATPSVDNDEATPEGGN